MIETLIPPEPECPRCVADGAPVPGVIRPVATLPGVMQCSRCWYRVAYGEPAPRVTVYRNGQWTCLTFEDGDQTVGIQIDAGLAALIRKNLQAIE